MTKYRDKTRSRPFERTLKRHKGFPSETRVKRGQRTIRNGDVELLEKLGRNDYAHAAQAWDFKRHCPLSGSSTKSYWQD